ncbi:NAD-specific glutamate dehydrogenase [Pseudovibrio axinellae]|uniref:NAD-specific glutamate dehydrogenase n=1 Tax=Pseudovibrio axinellae TaxID=989403 RepID=A0A165Z9U4_9HYPH|nr:NAD-glutamate dehydrogenase [Pseudovibrio axinellae]KZL19634.1 NAD-specific glutamate dehydrogenase [Pseudovibrio axinellae]SEQ34988.1 glutamate dehydrogenase (NAD) [Pseudovibrio axinellae]
MSETTTEAKAGLIADTCALLIDENKDEARFAEDLFSHADAEDLLNYTPSELAVLSQEAWADFANHPLGTHRIRVFNPQPNADGKQLEDITVVEIVNDNMAFLVSSVMGAIQTAGHEVRIVLHPLFVVERDDNGNLQEFHGTVGQGGPSVRRESLIHIHLTRLNSEEDNKALEEDLELVLNDVRQAVNDWRPMRDRIQLAVEQYQQVRKKADNKQFDEAIAFLEWMAADNFTLLGVREFIFDDTSDIGELSLIKGSGLGILADPNVRVLRKGAEFVVMTPEIREFLLKPEPLIIGKANIRSRVHRQVHMDYIGVKLFDDEGKLRGELRIVGLFTATAYTRSTGSIPYIRHKTAKVMKKHGFDPESHSGRALRNILEGYPRDDLFQVDAETLSNFADAILQLTERPRIRLLSRTDKFDRFVSVIAYIPRDHFTTNIRERVGKYLASVYEGRMSAWYASFPEGPLARVHFIIGRYTGETPNPSQAELEAAVQEIIRTWTDSLKEALRSVYGNVVSGALLKRYGSAFDGEYTSATPAATATKDIRRIEQLKEKRPLVIRFYKREREGKGQISLRAYHLNKPIPLSARVPMLENLGFRVINERTYRITPADRELSYLHDTTLYLDEKHFRNFSEADIERLGALFLAVWNKQAGNDGYNRLALTAGLAWRDIAMIRALSRYLRQAGILYSEDYMWRTLNRYPQIAQRLVHLFYTRFDPALAASERAAQEGRLIDEVSASLDEVTSLDDDRILRRFQNLILATLRTNFFQLDEDGQPKSTFAFKLDPHKVEGLPKPLPYREIFVYSPRVEGVHMRFGPAARGGLRWSDRAQDYRTEVLGLVKAQQVKNAVIVPVGAKGGFLPKQLPKTGSRDEWIAEGTEAYKIFISSLLDLTDNLDADLVLPPELMVRHDKDDPYLVVAADKGTATFSDTANAISEDKGFWLGDAFASGGSAGYDHKKMGITARGAWEAVKRHFREMNRDIQKEPFTACGVGDMSGDVFGNGMLLSKATKLVAAFDHRDIFLDPNPDPAATWDERKRMFDLGRSSWQDYNKELISEGGGIYSRSVKSIPLTIQVQKLLGLFKSKASPQEVMTAILMMKADLLWFGGIGTYIRASDENNNDVGDRANDAIRITASEVGAKVIGEGANLGITQKARIEFSRVGGRCNSDAIDNSAGVNSSDMEVNIKIALGAAVKKGILTVPDRNVFLADMTDEVADLVLRNNYLQTLAISLCDRRGLEDLGYQVRMMRQLESQDLLDRAVEDLPDDATIEEREKAGQHLSRPELGVLLAYAKLTLHDTLLHSSVPDDAYLGKELYRYFPEQMAETYSSEIEGHRLRREIIATMLANSIINRGGPAFLTRIIDQTGAAVTDVARAFAVVRDSFGLTQLNEDIDRLDNTISGELQLELYSVVQDLVLGQVIWFLRNVSFEGGLEAVISRFRDTVKLLSPRLETFLSEKQAETLKVETNRLVEAGVPVMIAARIARLIGEMVIPDMVLVSEKANRNVDEVAQSYFRVAEHFRFGMIEELAREFAIRDYYDGLALDRSRTVLVEALRNLTAQALEDENGFDGWLERNGAKAERTLKATNEILENDLSVSKFSVAAGMLAELTH